MADQQVKVILKGEDQTGAAFASAGKNTNELSGNLSGLSKVLLGATVAVGGLAIAFGVSAVKSAIEAENSVAQLNAVLESTHHAAGLFTEDILDQAAALQRYTTYNDEAVTSAANLLLTFTNIKGAIFQEALPAILDLSTAMGQDLKSSAVQVGKALNDPIVGITALQRVGVSFTEKQKETVKQLVETGHTMDAQRLILAELTKEFGGSAEAAAKTFDGRIKQLANTFDDLKENVGKVLIEALTPLLEALNTLAQYLAQLDLSFAAVGQTIQNVSLWIDSHTGLVTYLKEVWAAVIGIFRTEVLPVFQEIWQKHGPLLTEFGKALATVFGSLLVVAIKLTIDIVAGLAIGFAKLLEIGGQLFDIAMSVWEGTIDAFAKAWDLAKASVEAVANAIQKVLDLAAKAGSKVGSVLGISGARAEGGPVNSGETYLVGENGPELFTASRNGQIIPSLQMQTTTGMTFNINVSGNTLLDGNAGEKIADQIMRTLKANLRI
jgi:hypothetical protein